MTAKRNRKIIAFAIRAFWGFVTIMWVGGGLFRNLSVAFGASESGYTSFLGLVTLFAFILWAVWSAYMSRLTSLTIKPYSRQTLIGLRGKYKEWFKAVKKKPESDLAESKQKSAIPAFPGRECSLPDTLALLPDEEVLLGKIADAFDIDDAELMNSTLPHCIFLTNKKTKVAYFLIIAKSALVSLLLTGVLNTLYIIPLGILFLASLCLCALAGVEAF